MNVKIILLSLFCFTVIPVYGEENTTKVAVYSRDAVYRSSLIYRKLYMLTVKKEIKDAITKLNDKTEVILMEIINSEDEAEIKTLQQSLNTVESKKSSIMGIIQNKYTSNDTGAIERFIAGRYSKKYDVIIDKKLLGSSSNSIVINVMPIDITQAVIKDLARELN